MSALGVWQLHRAHVKARWLAAPHHAIQPWQTLHQAVRKPTRVAIQGHYRPHHEVWWTNHFLEHQPAHRVLTLFQPDTCLQGEANCEVWVDRGLQANTHTSAPPASTPTTIQGILSPYPSLFFLGDNTVAHPHHHVVQAPHPQMGDHLPAAFPNLLHLEPGQPGYLVGRPWAHALSPARHRGYAVQWFLMACVCGLGWYRLAASRA